MVFWIRSKRSRGESQEDHIRVHKLPKPVASLNQKDNQERQICPLKGRSRPAHAEGTPPYKKRTKEAQKLACTQPGNKQRALRDGPGNPTSACHHVGHGLSYHGTIRSTFSSQTWKHVFRHGLIFRLDAKTRWPWHSCCVRTSKTCDVQGTNKSIVQGITWAREKKVDIVVLVGFWIPGETGTIAQAIEQHGHMLYFGAASNESNHGAN